MPIPEEMITVPMWWFYTAMALAIIIIGIAKSGFGGGVGILAVPLTANVLPTQVALGVMLPILMAADVLAVWQHRGQQSWRHLRLNFAGAAVGIALGTALMFWFKTRATSDLAHQEQVLSMSLRLSVGVLCLLLVLVQCYRLTGLKVPRVPDNNTAGVVAGGLSGFVSMLTHGAGPIMSVYLLENRMEKRLLVGTLAVFFIVVNTAKVPSYLALGWITWPTFTLSAVCFLLVPIGSVLGLWMHKRIPQRPFTLIMYLGAAAAAGNMIYTAITHWPSISPS